jgi:hypothetical protein
MGDAGWKQLRFFESVFTGAIDFSDSFAKSEPGALCCYTGNENLSAANV